VTSFEWDARDYAQSSTGQQSWARELIEKLDLRGHERILDIGSGDGKVTAEIAACVPCGQVTGIDSSQAMVDFAQRRYPASQYANLRFMLCDALEIPFEAQYDVVFSSATLHWIIDHSPVLSGVSNALQTGGRALLQMGGEGNAREVIAVLEELLVESPWASFFVDFKFPYGFHSPQEYRVWLQRTQLEARRLELIPKDMLHAGVAGLQAWVRTTWLPYTSRIPLDWQDRFISEVAERFVQRHPLDADGLVHVRMVRLEADLVKGPSATVQE
jgi:trans-aconitate methyltransferase